MIKGGKGRKVGRVGRGLKPYEFFVSFVSSWIVLVVAGLAASAAALQTGAAASNPVAYSPQSIARGKTYFLQNCQSCHDEDGRARSAAVAIAADLTNPDRWKFGSADAPLFNTIKNGAAEAMPPFGTDLKDEQIWDVVNFIRSIGPDSKKPK